VQNKHSKRNSWRYYQKRSDSKENEIQKKRRRSLPPPYGAIHKFLHGCYIINSTMSIVSETVRSVTFAKKRTCHVTRSESSVYAKCPPTSYERRLYTAARRRQKMISGGGGEAKCLGPRFPWIRGPHDAETRFCVLCRKWVLLLLTNRDGINTY